jgi:lipoprotein-anchoring transpeptidase ErfK/SrfK
MTLGQLRTSRQVVWLLLVVSLGTSACAPESRSPAGPIDRSRPDARPIFRQTLILANVDGDPVCPSPTTLVGTVTSKETTARSAPDPTASPIATFTRINQQGSPQVFDLLEGVGGSDDRYWAKVLLPIRPNGVTGYIPQDQLRVNWTPYALGVSRHHLKLIVWKECQQVATYPIGLGTRETPTPTGVFYLASLLRPDDPKGVYGEYAYGLSGYSGAIKTWKWGGLVGLHGTNDPSSVGRRMSHGCIRMLNRDIGALVDILPLGTPISIT